MEYVSFDGVDYNEPDCPYLLLSDAENRSGYAIETSYRDRMGQTPLREGISVAATERVFIVVRNPQYTGTAKTAAQMRDDTFMHFQPSAGERILVARLDRYDDQSPEVFTQVDVSALDYWQRTSEDDYITGVFRIADGTWRSTTSATDPATVAGTAVARPAVTISGGTACTRTTYEIGESSTRGLAGHPVKLPSTLGNDTWVFDRGRSVPFNTDGWLRLDIPARRKIQLDVFTVTGIANPLAGELDLGGLDSASTNASWQITDWSVSDHPAADGAVRPAKLGQTFQGISYGIDSEGGSVVIGIEGGDIYDRLFDAVAVPTGRRASSATFTASLSDGMDCRAFISKLTPGAVRYQRAAFVAHANTSQEEVEGGDMTGGSVAGAIAIAIGIEPLRSVEHYHMEYETDENDNTTSKVVGDGYPRATGRLTISGTLTINFSESITITTVSTQAARAFDGAMVKNTTTGDVIRLRRVFTVSDLVIDTYNKAVIAAAGRAYCDIRFTNQHAWFRLAPGSNAVAATGCNAAWSYQPRYVML